MIAALVRKELASLWWSPVPWVTGAAFHAAGGLLAVDTMQARAQASFQPIVPIAAFLVLIAAPVLTMRAVAEERRSGTLDLLLVARVPTATLVFAKWVSIWASLVVLVAPIGLHALLLSWWGEPDTGPILTGLVGLVLLAAAATAVGVAASAATSSQAAAALASAFVLLLGWFLRPTTSSVALRTVTARLSLNERLRTFAAGGIELGAATFLVAVTAAAVLGAAAVLAVGGGRRPRRREGAVVAVVAVLVVAAQWRVDGGDALLDLTEARSLTLSAETTGVLDELDRDVRITAFLRDTDIGRGEAGALLHRYEAASTYIRARILDPDAAPGEAARLGVDRVLGGVVVEPAGGTAQTASSVTEQDLTLALARVVRGALPTLCLTTGHGELDPSSTLPTGLASAVGILRSNGYRTVTVDLLTRSQVPASCGAVVVVVAPAVPMGDAQAVVEAYLNSGGRIALFLEPGFDHGLEGVLEAAGVAVLGGTVLEGDPESMYPGDPAAPIVRRYSSSNPIVRALAPTFLVTAGGIEVTDDRPGRVVSRLADTSELAVLVTDDDTTVAGPITVAAATESVANDGEHVSRQRVVVVADGDVVSNALIGEAANAQLLVQAADWLTTEEDLVSVTANLAADRPLQLTAARRDYARLLTAVLVPAAFLLAGVSGWVIRRSR